jgi:hypothetical protein
MAIQENEYRAWLAGNSGLSHKGQNDLISRLRRGDKLVQITDGLTYEKYASELTRHSTWNAIPKASQQSILAAARKYISWRTSSVSS